MPAEALSLGSSCWWPNFVHLLPHQGTLWKVQRARRGRTSEERTSWPIFRGAARLWWAQLALLWIDGNLGPRTEVRFCISLLDGQANIMVAGSWRVLLKYIRGGPLWRDFFVAPYSVLRSSRCMASLLWMCMKLCSPVEFDGGGYQAFTDHCWSVQSYRVLAFYVKLHYRVQDSLSLLPGSFWRVAIVICLDLHLSCSRSGSGFPAGHACVCVSPGLASARKPTYNCSKADRFCAGFPVNTMPRGDLRYSCTAYDFTTRHTLVWRPFVVDS